MAIHKNNTSLAAETFEAPEFFILTGEEAFVETKPTKSGRDYIDIGPLRRKAVYNGKWEKITDGLITTGI